jgi:hypothetical protein
VFSRREVQLGIEVRVLVRHRGELVGTALVAGDPLACTPVIRNLVVLVRGPELGCKFEG